MTMHSDEHEAYQGIAKYWDFEAMHVNYSEIGPVFNGPERERPGCQLFNSYQRDVTSGLDCRFKHHSTHSCP